MPLYYESWKRTCDEVGLEFAVERFYAFAGRPVSDIFQQLIEEQLGVSQDRCETGERCRSDVDKNGTMPKTKKIITADYCEAAKRRHHAAIEAEGRTAGPVDVVVEIAARWHGIVPLAVASSGWRDHVVAGLQRVGILGLFDEVVTACDEEVQSPKPAPDIFLVAAKRLGVRPDECVGFEDADLGMEALRKAGYMYASDVREMYMYPRNVEGRLSNMNSLESSDGKTSTMHGPCIVEVQ